MSVFRPPPFTRAPEPKVVQGLALGVPLAKVDGQAAAYFRQTWQPPIPPPKLTASGLPQRVPPAPVPLVIRDARFPYEMQTELAQPVRTAAIALAAPLANASTIDAAYRREPTFTRAPTITRTSSGAAATQPRFELQMPVVLPRWPIEQLQATGEILPQGFTLLIPGPDVFEFEFVPERPLQPLVQGVQSPPAGFVPIAAMQMPRAQDWPHEVLEQQVPIVTAAQPLGVPQPNAKAIEAAYWRTPAPTIALEARQIVNAPSAFVPAQAPQMLVTVRWPIEIIDETLPQFTASTPLVQVPNAKAIEVAYWRPAPWPRGAAPTQIVSIVPPVFPTPLPQIIRAPAWRYQDWRAQVSTTGLPPPAFISVEEFTASAEQMVFLATIENSVFLIEPERATFLGLRDESAFLGEVDLTTFKGQKH